MSRQQACLNDIWSGLKLWRVWWAFAIENIRRVYHRTLLGALWISLSFCAFVGVKIVVFGTLLGNMSSYSASYILLGFMGWSFVSQIVTTSPHVFLSNASWIKNDPLPFSVYSLQSVMQDFFSFLMTTIAVVALYWMTGSKIGPHALLFFPAVAVVLFNGFWLKLWMGVVCTRLRDVTQIINSIMRMMIFLTPIFWTPDQMGDRLMSILWWNPFYHFIDIMRIPILEGHFALASWQFVGFVTLLNVLTGFIVFCTYRRRIAFWV